MSAEIRVRRIVLAVDSAERALRVVREAVQLASSLDAELEGLFVEDDALLRLAGHAFARSHASSGSTQRISARELEREWRALASEVRRELEREAELERVRSSFAVSRGVVELALRERLARGDLVLVAWGGWSPSALSRPAPVRVLYEGRAGSDRVLDVAARIAQVSGELTVWVVPDGERATLLAEQIRHRLGGRVSRVRIAGLRDAAPSTVRAAIAAEPGGILVVPDAHALAGRLAERSLVARFPCTVVIVR